MGFIHRCLPQSMCCQKRCSVGWCTVWYNLMLRDVLLRYWPEWCHVVTVAVCKGKKKKKQTPGPGANDAVEDIPVPDLCPTLLFGSWSDHCSH